MACVQIYSGSGEDQPTFYLVIVSTGFVRHLEILEFLEFWKFLAKAWDSLKNRCFFPSDLEKSLNFSWLVTNQSHTFCFCHVLKYLIVFSSFSPSYSAVFHHGMHQLPLKTS